MTAFPCIIFPAFLVLVIVLIVFGQKAEAERRKRLAGWAAGRGLRFSPANDPSFDERHPEFDCLRSGDNRYAYNIVHGPWGPRQLLAFDYHYETTSTDSKGRRSTTHHHFSAIILRSTVLLQPLVIRPEGFLDKIGGFLGFDDIDFESAEFSRRFYVKAPNRRWAYDVLHPQAMEFLLRMPPHRIEFDPLHVIVWRNERFEPPGFEGAIAIAAGLLDGLPDYLVRQQREQAGMRP